ncbi:hypothetical protein [Nonomuraea sp. NPDC049758]|uniref:hypothetical protein n=1 Tax=Nonomuraea sp. NPDC049758 TaxID=3154360 RepID=UPI0034221BA0
MHWHAYTWFGNGQDLKHEAERRPTSPDFPTSALPPMRTGDWLIKPRSRIAETFADAVKAGEWMAAAYAAQRPDSDRIPVVERLVTSVDLLPRGVDVQWGEWLPGGRFITIGVICCPNRHVDHPCPQPPVTA